MSSVFKRPKVKYIQPKEVAPMTEEVDRVQSMLDLEKKRKKKMGAVSQMLSHDNSYGANGEGKTTLGA